MTEVVVLEGEVVDRTPLECSEEIIERNLGAVFETGRELMRIRDEELYLERGFDGFVEYLESKPWGIGKSEAYNTIATYRVSNVLETEHLPIRHANALAPLLKKKGPESVRQVYSKVLDEAGDPAKVTGAAIREKVRKILPDRKKRKPNKKREGPAHYLPDLISDDAPENVRAQAVRWFERGRQVGALLDKGSVPVPKSAEDKRDLRKDADLMIHVATKLKEVLK